MWVVSNLRFMRLVAEMIGATCDTLLLYQSWIIDSIGIKGEAWLRTRLTWDQRLYSLSYGHSV